jgi:hypothetical protein
VLVPQQLVLQQLVLMVCFFAAHRLIQLLVDRMEHNDYLWVVSQPLEEQPQQGASLVA